MTWLESVWLDARYAFRTLRRQPSVSLVALLILTLSIGLLATFFSVVSNAVLRPWSGIKDPAPVIRIYAADPVLNERIGLSHPEYQYLASQTTSLAGLAAWRNENVRLDAQRGDTTRITLATASFFDVLGIGIARGRGLSSTDESPGAGATGRRCQRRSVAATVRSRAGDCRARDPSRRSTAPSDRRGIPELRWLRGQRHVDLDSHRRAGTLASRQPRGRVENKPENCCSQIAGRLAPGVSVEQAQSEVGVLSQQFRSSVSLRPSTLC